MNGTDAARIAQAETDCAKSREEAKTRQLKATELLVIQLKADRDLLVEARAIIAGLHSWDSQLTDAHGRAADFLERTQHLSADSEVQDEGGKG